jgi:hypothetical protein
MKTLAIDFDGVLSAYRGWKGPSHLDAPLEGAIDALRRYMTVYEVVIFTTRADTEEGGAALRSWLRNAGLKEEEIDRIEITNRKPPAWLYIDDRCHLFTGNFPSVEEIDAFKPYWQNNRISALSIGR